MFIVNLLGLSLLTLVVRAQASLALTRLLAALTSSSLLPLGIVKASFSSAINFVDFSFACCKSSNMFGFYSLN